MWLLFLWYGAMPFLLPIVAVAVLIFFLKSKNKLAKYSVSLVFVLFAAFWWHSAGKVRWQEFDSEQKKIAFVLTVPENFQGPFAVRMNLVDTSAPPKTELTIPENRVLAIDFPKSFVNGLSQSTFRVSTPSGSSTEFHGETINAVDDTLVFYFCVEQYKHENDSGMVKCDVPPSFIDEVETSNDDSESD